MDQRHPHYLNNNNNSFLTKGSQVEVSSDEDGLNGAWFVATVIHPPPSISTAKKDNHHTRNNLVYVEYQNLLSEDGSSRRLREYANVSYVRPSPHRDTSAAAPHFQLNDLVDAFHRDGWWTGVITAVVDSSNFVVTFQNPPDQIQFHSSALRVHRRWDGGRWVQPEIQRTAGLMFTVGKRVEVSFEGENLRDAWFPATVVDKLGNNCFAVEYQQPGIGDEATPHKVTVDYLHIRPSPPHLRDKNFVLLEKVDAYYDCGWWSGVITKVLADNSYIVFFKRTKKEREFVCSRVRPHMEWTGGKWFTTSQRSKRGKGVAPKTPIMNSSEEKERLETEGAKDDPLSQEKDVDIIGVQCNGMKLEQLSSERIPDVALAPIPLIVVDKEGEAETAVTPTPKRKRGRPPKLQAISPPETPVAAAAAVNNHENGGTGPEDAQRSASSGTKPPLEQAAPIQKNTSSEDVPSSNDRLAMAMANENAGHVVQVQEGKKYSSMKGKQGKRRTISLNSESPTDDSKEKTDKDDDLATRNVEGKSMSEDRPLSRWSVQSPMTTSVHGTEGSVEQPASERQSEIVTSPPPPPSTFGDKLPFMITTPLWKTIESMEAFRKIPQKPHFGPLESVKESGREGLAIGSMVTFSTVVDKTCALRFEDPRSAIEDCLETLLELEPHGFEVELIRDRLTQLLLIKDRQEELEQRSKGIAQKLEAANLQGKKTDQEIGEIEREITELEERRRQLVSDKDKHESEVTRVTEAAVDGIHQQLREVGVEFDGLAAAPFLTNIIS